MSRQTIDLDKIDPDWELAQQHARSSRPGIYSQQNKKLCECCLNVVHKQSVPLDVHSKDLEFLGFGFPLWYSFLKHCIFLLLIIVITQSIFSIYTALKYNKQLCGDFQGSIIKQIKNQHIPRGRPHGHLMLGRQINHNQGYPHINQGEVLKQKQASEHDGNHHSCTGLFLRLSRREDQVSDQEAISRVCTYLITMIFLLYIRDSINKTQQYYDQRTCSMADYSVIIQNLSQTKHVQTSITSFIANNFLPPLKIQQIILIPQIQSFKKLQQQKKQQIQKLQKHYKISSQSKSSQDQLNHKEIKLINKRLAQIQNKQKIQIQSYEAQQKNDVVKTNDAIAILSTQAQKQTLLQYFDNMDKQQLSAYFGPKGSLVQIRHAPQPRQIIWQNINYSNYKRLGLIFLNWTLGMVFIAIVTILFLFILIKKSQYVQDKQGRKRATFTVYIALILVIFFNKFIMGTVLHHLTDNQRHKTSDKFQFSFAFKYALGMFFTTALMTLFVQAFYLNNFDKHQYGVIDQQSIMFFLNSLLVPVIWMINPFQLLVQYKRNKNKNKSYLTQRQANHLMEDFNYDIGKRYAEVLQSLWFTFLYSSLIPIGSILTLIGIILYYWVDKYNLLRRSSIRQNVSGKFLIMGLKMLDLILIFIPLGWIIFDYKLKKEQQKQHFLSFHLLFMGIVYQILPLNKILNYFNTQSFKIQQRPFKQVCHNFKDTYKNLHPIYSKTQTQKRRSYDSKIKLKQEIVRRLQSNLSKISQIEPVYT